MVKFLFLLVILALIFGLVGVYGLFSSFNLGKTLEEALQKLDLELQRLTLKTAPYIYTGEAVGYVIEFENGVKFYFGGDTGASADLKLLVGDYYQPEVAFIPIGNYYTMDSQLAAYAAKLINPSRFVIPNHYGSFPMLTQDPSEFFEAIKKYQLRAKPLKFEVGKEQEILGIKALWLGHGAWFFESPQGTKILIDPEVEYNVAYPEDWKDLTKFERIDLILITHGHFDHMTIPDLRKWVDLYQPLIIAPFEAGVWLKEYLQTPIMAINKGASISKAEMLKMGITEDQIKNINPQIRIHLVPSTHSSSATPEGLPAKY
jgi:L-ascorbate metabolism protein UlaG (beta-lactamase superfamily)